MKSFLYLGLIVVGLLKFSYIIDADHCENTNDQLLPPKKDLNISLEEPDSCSLSYLAILNPSSNPLRDDDCKIRGFHLNDGTVGPSCIPEIGNLEKNNIFSINMKNHRTEAGLLLNVLLQCSTFEDFKNAALYYKSKVNPMMFSHVFNSAIMNRDDTEAYSAPSLLQSQPELLFSNKLIQEANQKINNGEKKVLKQFKPTKNNFRKPEGLHGNHKYNKNVQLFDPNKNNINFQTTTNIQLGAGYGIVGNEILYGPPALSPEILYGPPMPSLSYRPPMPSLSYQPPMPSLSYEPPMQSPPQGPPNDKFFLKVPKKPSKLPFIPVPTEDAILILRPDRTGSERNPEQQLSYFREDISISSHHSHWHQVYPDGMAKNRQGELFYYMHNQMLRRYDAARRAAGLQYVKPLEIEEAGTIIEEGYYPHLTSNTGQHYSGRSKGLRMRDVILEDQKPVFLKVVVEYINRVKKAIKDKVLINGVGRKFPLNNNNGIDILGKVIECSQGARDNLLEEYYGSIHNDGHILLSQMHDATMEYNAPFGVMASVETALRDPVFWRWHKMVDTLFDLHKALLPQYPDTVLTWNQVQINEFVIQTDNSHSSYKPQTCYTYFNKRDVEIRTGLDLKINDNAVKVRMTHLDNLPFTYNLKVHNKEGYNVEGHVRIFFSPKYTENMKLATEEQLRKHAIEMDRFTIEFNPGSNDIVRKSTESAVTLTPGLQWAKLLENNVEFSASQKHGGNCGCGWPSHLLLPKGNETGIKYVAFVMISNWENEKVDESGIERTCGSSLTMCGLKNRDFPDKRSMGFPLDRPFHKKKWFQRANMKKTDITIYHLDD